MSRTLIQKRGRLFRGSLLCAFVASLVLGLVVEGHLHAAHANGGNNPAKYAFIVILDGGHPELYNATNAPFLTSLERSIGGIVQLWIDRKSTRLNSSHTM